MQANVPAPDDGSRHGPRPASHLAVLSRWFDPADRDAVDVGAGNGAFARQLASRGARVTGVEPNAHRPADAADMPATVVMVPGRGEALPLAASSQDLVCYIFAFHHVTASLQLACLGEALRVLRPGGRLHIAEPRPHGAMTEVVRPIDDETEIRLRAARRLDRLAGSSGLVRMGKADYLLVRRYRDFESLAAGVVAADPRRQARYPLVETEMRARFERFGRPTAEGTVIEQPCVAWHFGKPG